MPIWTNERTNGWMNEWMSSTPIGSTNLVISFLQMLLRIWDCFLFDGLRVLFQFAIALLEYHEASLLKKKDILAILKDTKSMAKLTQDVEAIVSVSLTDPLNYRQTQLPVL